MRTLLLLAMLGACSASPAAPSRSAEPIRAARMAPDSERDAAGAESMEASAPALTAPTAPTAPPVSEVEARVILSEMFRAAGFRIVYDVGVELGRGPVYVDGFDPEKRVGYEYVAAVELPAWKPAGPGADEAARVLVVGPVGRHRLVSEAQAFLDGIAADQSSDE